MDDRADVTATRRDFLIAATGAMGAVGAAWMAWPFIDQMDPDASTRAARFEIDLPVLEEGQSAKIKWLGKPLVFRRRTADEIREARAVSLDDLRDLKARNANLPPDAPATDLNRAVEGREDWIVWITACTHGFCITIGQQGDFGGWFCPCCGSHYDTAGRIRNGPGPWNLAIPKFRLLPRNRIRIG